MLGNLWRKNMPWTSQQNKQESWWTDLASTGKRSSKQPPNRNSKPGQRSHNCKFFGIPWKWLSCHNSWDTKSQTQNHLAETNSDVRAHHSCLCKFLSINLIQKQGPSEWILCLFFQRKIIKAVWILS